MSIFQSVGEAAASLAPRAAQRGEYYHAAIHGHHERRINSRDSLLIKAFHGSSSINLMLLVKALCRLYSHNAERYYRRMVRSFADRDTERLFQRLPVRKLVPDAQGIALRKLRIIDAAVSLEDLRSPPGNRLEKLKGTRAGQFSIRISDQWRICFRWEGSDAYEVEIVDYH